MTTFSKAELRINGKLIGLLSEVKYDVETRRHGAGGQKPKQENTMAQVKVIAVTAGEDFLKALEKLLGGKIEDIASGAVEASAEAVAEDEEEGCSCGCDDCAEENEPSVPFGSIQSEDEDDIAFYRTYNVPSAGDLNVVVGQDGVTTEGERHLGVEPEHFTNLFAPQGAFAEVEAFYDESDETLTVVLQKLGPEETVEIEGW
jgi:hypothetical protein